MTKLKIQVGNTTIELESDDLDADLRLALEAVTQLSNSSGSGPQQLGRNSSQFGQSDSAATAIGNFDHGINTYAAKFGSSSGRQLLRSAALHLTLVDGQENFSRDELFARAHEAREWKKTFSNAQATDLRRMVAAGELIERSSGRYSLPSKVIGEASRELEG